MENSTTSAMANTDYANGSERGALSHKKRFSTFFSAIFVFTLIQIPIDSLSKTVDTVESANYRFVGENLGEKRNEISVACVGDSLIKHALSPSTLEHHIEKSTINLAIAGAQPIATYYLLKRLFVHPKKPTLVLLGYDTGILQSGGIKAAHESAELFTLNDCIDIFLTTGDSESFRVLLLSKIVPLYKINQRIVYYIEQRLKTSDWFDRILVATYWRNWQRNRGQTLESPQNVCSSPQKDLANKIAWRKAIRARMPWHCESVNKLYLEKILRLTNNNSVRVYWLITPANPIAQTEMDSCGLSNSYNNFLKELQKQHPNLFVIDGTSSNYKTLHFIDAGHFQREGSIPYSTQIGKTLASGLVSRWLNLPKSTEWNDDTSFEDTLQSSKHVRATSTHF